jgi:dethiobiotin synthetase
MQEQGSSKTIFITGTGTGIGKTYVSAILTEALEGDYWKPIQAGVQGITDTQWVKSMISNERSRIHEEGITLKLAASPHIAARYDKTSIHISDIVNRKPVTSNTLVIEGAGGLMVPLNENEFIVDLIVAMHVPVILVSRNQLGSINHSLLTAMACRQKGIEVLGWIFNDEYLDYSDQIVKWTGIPSICSIPFHPEPDKNYIKEQAVQLRTSMKTLKW